MNVYEIKQSKTQELNISNNTEPMLIKQQTLKLKLVFYWYI